MCSVWKIFLFYQNVLFVAHCCQAFCCFFSTFFLCFSVVLSKFWLRGSSFSDQFTNIWYRWIIFETFHYSLTIHITYFAKFQSFYLFRHISIRLESIKGQFSTQFRYNCPFIIYCSFSLVNYFFNFDFHLNLFSFKFFCMIL